MLRDFALSRRATIKKIVRRSFSYGGTGCRSPTGGTIAITLVFLPNKTMLLINILVLQSHTHSFKNFSNDFVGYFEQTAKTFKPWICIKMSRL